MSVGVQHLIAKRHVAISQFDASSSTEVSLAIGDICETIPSANTLENDWSLVKNLTTGSTGFVPSNHLQTLPNQAPSTPRRPPDLVTFKNEIDPKSQQTILSSTVDSPKVDIPQNNFGASSVLPALQMLTWLQQWSTLPHTSSLRPLCWTDQNRLAAASHFFPNYSTISSLTSLKSENSHFNISQNSSNFRDIIASNSSQRFSSLVSSLKKHGRGRPPYRSVELIVGMGVFEHGRFKKLTVRNKYGIGGKEAILVPCEADAKQIEAAAVKQHKANNRLISDGVPVRYIPGGDEPFVLKKYKELRNDSWIRLRLFLCPSKQLLLNLQSNSIRNSSQTKHIVNREQSWVGESSKKHFNFNDASNY